MGSWLCCATLETAETLLLRHCCAAAVCLCSDQPSLYRLLHTKNNPALRLSVSLVCKQAAKVGLQHNVVALFTCR